MSLSFGARQFNELGRQGFEQRLVKLIRGTYPQESADISPTELSRMIWEQVRRAERYGLVDEQSAATFVVTAWLLGVDFDTTIPSMRQLLNDPALSARSKSQAMADFTQVVFGELEVSSL